MTCEGLARWDCVVCVFPVSVGCGCVLTVGMIVLGGFLSSDLAVISWAMNIVCGVTWWPLGSCL